MNFLQATFQLDDSYRAHLMGLMGNFNGNASDDYTFRNGTALAANSSERQLFQMGQSWMLNATESILYYPDGKNQSDFCHAAFVPVFVEDFRDRANMLTLFRNNSLLMSQANAVSVLVAFSIVLWVFV